MPAWVLHLDMDQFVAAVEIQRRPELAGIPLIVGGRGDPNERAVVATASYAARAFGAHSGMPLRLAARKCPDAIILPVDHAAYEEASQAVFAAVRTVPGVVLEPLGWDECFIGADTADPEGLARRIQARVLEVTRLHCTIGIGDNKIRAKNATGFGKPRGLFRLTRENWLEVMGERPVGELWGVGKRISARLETHGYRTVTELASADREVLIGEFGPKMGLWYAALGRGEGSAVVDDTPWVARSHSRETTYQTDLVTPEAIRSALEALVEQVVEDCAAEGRPVVRVGLKVRYAPFFTVNRSKKLAAPTPEKAPVLDAVLALAASMEAGRAVRLLGVRGEMVMPPGEPRERAPTRARI